MTFCIIFFSDLILSNHNFDTVLPGKDNIGNSLKGIWVKESHPAFLE